MKHFRDDDWVTITYDQAREEQEKLNASKTKKSYIFQTPSKDNDGGTNNTGSRSSNNNVLRTKAAQGSYVPAQRNVEKEQGSWRPNAREDEEEMS